MAYTKRDWLLLIGVVTVTTAAFLIVVRWFAPQLLGIPIDLQAVQVSEKIPPFFDNTFRREDYRSRDLILKDPVTRVRAKPLYPEIGGLGPHDILGFRNRRVPNVADVVIIGDSQTYGNNVILEENWPSSLAKKLKKMRPVIYSMATGGWGAVQYLDMFGHATVFRPKVVVVAFYSGNDSQESISLAYSAERWTSLRPDPELDRSDKPKNIGFPPPDSELWRVRFKDGTETTFSPSLRLISNDSTYSTVRAGYAVMQEVGRQMSEAAKRIRVSLIFAIIPTKELVYARKVERSRLQATVAYRKLVDMEQKNIDALAAEMNKLPNVTYVDLVKPLQQAALQRKPLYPDNMNGHPLARGYRVIAQTLAPAVRAHLAKRPQGLVAVRRSENSYEMSLVRHGGRWIFASPELVAKNGWGVLGEMPITQPRDVATIPLRGLINTVDPQRFGPAEAR